MKRKLLVLTLVTALTASLLVGCENTKEPTAETEVETVEETVEAEPEVVEDEPTETVAAKPLNLEPVNLEELGLTLAEEAAEDEEVEAEVEEEKETVKEEKTETNTNVVANNTTTAANNNTTVNNTSTPAPAPAPQPTGWNCATQGHQWSQQQVGVIARSREIHTGQYEQVCVQEAWREPELNELGEAIGIIEHPAVYETREIITVELYEDPIYANVCSHCGARQ